MEKIFVMAIVAIAAILLILKMKKLLKGEDGDCGGCGYSKECTRQKGCLPAAPKHDKPEKKI